MQLVAVMSFFPQAPSIYFLSSPIQTVSKRKCVCVRRKFEIDELGGRCKYCTLAKVKNDAKRQTEKVKSLPQPEEKDLGGSSPLYFTLEQAIEKRMKFLAFLSSFLADL